MEFSDCFFQNCCKVEEIRDLESGLRVISIRFTTEKQHYYLKHNIPEDSIHFITGSRISTTEQDNCTLIYSRASNPDVLHSAPISVLVAETVILGIAAAAKGLASAISDCAGIWKTTGLGITESPGLKGFTASGERGPTAVKATVGGIGRASGCAMVSAVRGIVAGGSAACVDEGEGRLDGVRLSFSARLRASFLLSPSK